MEIWDNCLVTSGKLLKVCGSVSSYVNRHHNNPYLIGLLRGLNDSIQVMGFEESGKHSKSLNKYQLLILLLLLFLLFPDGFSESIIIHLFSPSFLFPPLLSLLITKEYLL